ncbi:MAG: diguanylate phosphodiesterase [Pseudomonas sp.]|nr:diguanylate phosphodiesterase [Pseudomonas sp.]
MVSRAGLFAGKPAPTAASINPRCVSTPIRCRSGFTREYGSGGNGERRVKIGQQGRPLRG